jgi:hypothetical protein
MPEDASVRPRAFQVSKRKLFSVVAATVLACFTLLSVTFAAGQPDPTTEQRAEALIPDLEAYIANGMKAFDLPGLAIGIVSGNKLVYAKGFGVRSKKNSLPVDTRTVCRRLCLGMSLHGYQSRSTAKTLANLIDAWGKSATTNPLRRGRRAASAAAVPHDPSASSDIRR